VAEQAGTEAVVAQPAIGQTGADLEQELRVKLFSRAKRITQLTPEGELFYAEAVRALAQAEAVVDNAKRAEKGEIGRLSIGFLGSQQPIPVIQLPSALNPTVETREPGTLWCLAAARPKIVT